MRSALAISVLVLAPLACHLSLGADASALPDFLATVRIHGPEGMHDEIAFGVSSNGTEGYVPGLDIAAPPPPPSGTWVHGVILAKNASINQDPLAQSVLPSAPTADWSATITSSGAAGMISLTWRASDFAAIPDTDEVTFSTLQGASELPYDTTLNISHEDGTSSTLVRIHVGPLTGTPPSPPQNLTASLGPMLGQVTLQWQAPAANGGHRIRAYEIERADGREGFEPIARTGQAHFTDDDAKLGHVYTYRVLASNRVGSSNASNTASMIGTRKPLGLQPATPQDDPVLLGVSRSDDVRTPGTAGPLVTMRVGQNPSDERQFGGSLNTMGQEHSAYVFTGAPVGYRAEEDLGAIPSMNVVETNEELSVRSHHEAQRKLEAPVVVWTIGANGFSLGDAAMIPLP